MSNPATPLNNQTAITQLNQSLNFIVDQIIRPTAIQSRRNSELIESNARAIAAEGEQVNKLRESVEVLRDVADDVAAESDDYAPRIPANEKRFETLLAEARADRQCADNDRAEYARRFDAQLADIQRQKAESDRRFNEQMTEIRAQGEQIRALLSALATTNGRIDGLEQVS